jgi:DNA-binding transcriptional LysR family regulator
MDRIEAMETFVAVADLKGFAPAARKLQVSASAVTRMVAALEERIGARLLQRTTRSVALTDVGERYLARARRILAEVEEAEAAARADRTRPSGHLIVSAPLMFGRLHVNPLMSDYLSRYPEVSGELRLSDRTINLVEEGVDLAIRIGHLQDSSVVAKAVGDMYRMVVAAPSYLVRRGMHSLFGGDALDRVAFPAGRTADPRRHHAALHYQQRRGRGLACRAGRRPNHGAGLSGRRSRRRRASRRRPGSV